MSNRKEYTINELKEGIEYCSIPYINAFGYQKPRKYKILNNTLYCTRMGDWNEDTQPYNELRKLKFIKINNKENNTIDWSKVPGGTLVQVRDYSDEEWITKRFVSFDCKTSTYPFITKDPQDDSLIFYAYHQCRIHPSVKILDEWLG